MLSNTLLRIEAFSKTALIVPCWKELIVSFQMIPVSSSYVKSFRSYARFGKVHYVPIVKSHAQTRIRSCDLAICSPESYHHSIPSLGI